MFLLIGLFSVQSQATKSHDQNALGLKKQSCETHLNTTHSSSIISVFINLTIEDACSVRSNILQLVDHRVKRNFAGSLFVNDWHPGFDNTHHLLLKLKVNVLIITWHSWGHSQGPSAVRTFQKGWPSPRRCQDAPESSQHFVVVHKKEKRPTDYYDWPGQERQKRKTQKATTDRVFNVFAVLRVFSIGVPVVPGKSKHDYKRIKVYDAEFWVTGLSPSPPQGCNDPCAPLPPFGHWLLLLI